jgi:long-chain fatty acid transport protein
LVAGLAVAVAALAGAGMGTSGAYAGGLEGKGIGSRQIGMGSASIGLADDFAALYWNPAGLAFLSGSELAFEFHMILTEQRASGSLKNVDSPLTANFLQGDFVKFGATTEVEPHRFDNNVLPANIPSPDVVWYENHGNYTLATGLFVSSATGVKWRDTVEGFEGTDIVSGDVEVIFVTMTLPLAIAFKLNERLAVGVNMGLVFGHNSRDVAKRYESTTDPSRNMEFSNDTTSRGLGVSMQASALYKLTPELHLGAVVRAPFAVYSRGDARFALGTEERDTLSSTTYHPLKADFGVCYRPFSTLVFAADAAWVKHSDYKVATDYDTDGHMFMSDGVTDWNMRDTWQFRVGAEYLASSRLSLRVGGLRDPSPYRASSASLATPRFNDATMLTAGAGYAWESLRVDVGYQYGLVPERRGNGISVTGAVQIASLSTSYTF